MTSRRVIIDDKQTNCGDPYLGSVRPPMWGLTSDALLVQLYSAERAAMDRESLPFAESRLQATNLTLRLVREPAILHLPSAPRAEGSEPANQILCTCGTVQLGIGRHKDEHN